MKMFVICCSFMFILLNLAPQNVITFQPKGVFAEIDTSADNKMMNDLCSRDYAVLKNAIDEVRRNINKYSPPVIYTFAYALFINGKKKEKDESVKWLYVGMIRVIYDENRCNDPSAKDAAAILNDKFSDKILKYAYRNKKLLKKQVYSAIDFVARNNEKYDSRWINLHGLWAFRSINDENFKAELSVPAEQWKAIKKKTIEEFKNSFDKSLNK